MPVPSVHALSSCFGPRPSRLGQRLPEQRFGGHAAQVGVLQGWNGCRGPLHQGRLSKTTLMDKLVCLGLTTRHLPSRADDGSDSGGLLRVGRGYERAGQRTAMQACTCLGQSTTAPPPPELPGLLGLAQKAGCSREGSCGQQAVGRRLRVRVTVDHAALQKLLICASNAMPLPNSPEDEE